VAEGWTPELRLDECGGWCRLSLGGYVHGHGATLQAAGDNLVDRLMAAALSYRLGSGFRLSPEAPEIDGRWLEFVHEVGELAAQGVDIRDWLFAARV
jgi:hypothetical protein